MCLSLQNQQMTGSHLNPRVYLRTCALQNYMLLVLMHVKLERTEMSQYNTLQGWVRKLSFKNLYILSKPGRLVFSEQGKIEFSQFLSLYGKDKILS